MRPARSMRVPRRRIHALVLGAMLAVVGVARAIDLTNTWAVTFAGGPCNWSITQTGTALTFSGGTGCTYLSVSGSGTIDSTTGAFTALGTIVFPGIPPIFDGISITAVASPAGTSFAGTATTTFGSMPISGSLCRNGFLDPGEACDDGTNPQGCCTNTCTPEPDGQACVQPPHNQCATGTTCAAGACVGTPGPPARRAKRTPASVRTTPVTAPAHVASSSARPAVARAASGTPSRPAPVPPTAGAFSS